MGGLQTVTGPPSQGTVGFFTSPPARFAQSHPSHSLSVAVFLWEKLQPKNRPGEIGVHIRVFWPMECLWPKNETNTLAQQGLILFGTHLRPKWSPFSTSYDWTIASTLLALQCTQDLTTMRRVSAILKVWVFHFMLQWDFRFLRNFVC